MKETIKAKEEDVAEKYLRDNNVDVDFYVEKGLNEIKKYRTNKDIVMYDNKKLQDTPPKTLSELDKNDSASDICEDCNGTGDDYQMKDHTSYPVCWTCNGSGKTKKR